MRSRGPPNNDERARRFRQAVSQFAPEEVRRPPLQIGVPALLRFLRAVKQAGQLAPHLRDPCSPVLVGVQCRLGAGDRRRGVHGDPPDPLGRPALEIPVGVACVDQSHGSRFLGVHVPAQEPHFPGPLLADEPGHPRAPVAGVEGSHPGSRLAEDGPLRGDRQVADHVEDVAPADGVSVDDAQNGLGRPAHLHLEFEDPQLGLRLGPVLVSPVVRPDGLVTAGAKGGSSFGIIHVGCQDDHRDAGVVGR